MAFKWPAVFGAIAVTFGLILYEKRRQPTDVGIAVPTLDPMLAGVGLILIGMILSSLASPALGLGLHLTLRVGALALFALVLSRHPAQSPELIWIAICLFISMVLQGLIAIGQFVFPDWPGMIWPVLEIGRAGRSAMIGTIGNPEYLAGWLSIGGAMATVLIIAAHYENEWSRKRLYRLTLGLAALMIIMALAVIFLSGGRGALLGYVGALALAGLIYFRRDSRPRIRMNQLKLFFWVLTACLIALILIPLALQSPERRGTVLPQRLFETFDVHSPPIRHRIGLLIITSEMIAEDPILGAGPRRYGTAFVERLSTLASEERGAGYWMLGDILGDQYIAEAHCDPLQWWAEYGLLPAVGLSILIVWSLVVGAGLIRHNRLSAIAAATWAGLAAVAIGMWFSFPLQQPVRAMTFWVLLGLLAGQIHLQSRFGRAGD